MSQKLSIKEVCKKYGLHLVGPDHPIYKEPVTILFRNGSPKVENQKQDRKNENLKKHED